MHMKSVLALFALMSLAAPAAQDAQKIEWKPKVGEAVNLKMAIAMEMPQIGAIDVQFLIKSKVTKIDKEKSEVTTQSEMSDFQLFMGGQPLDMGGQAPTSNEKVTLVQKLNGQIVSDSSSAEMGGERVSRMNAFHFPDKPMKVGDSWEHEWKANKEENLGPAKARWTYSAHEVKDGVDCWKIDYVFAEMEDPNGISASGTIWLDTASGQIHYSNYQFNNVSFQEGMPPTSGTGQITRVK